VSSYADESNRPPQFFAVGTGRCGSTLLSDLIGLHPEVLSLQEMWTVLGGGELLDSGPLSGTELWELLSRPSVELQALLRRVDVPEVLAHRAAGHSRESISQLAPLLLITLPPLSDRCVDLFEEIGREVRPYSRDRPAAQFARLFAWLCQRLHKRIWLERSGASLEYAGALVSAFPQARFVHIARDGRDCAYSMANHPVFRVKLARTLAKRPLPIDECLSSDIPIDRFGAYWSALMLRARSLHQLGPARVLLVRYEALIQQPEAQLGRLGDFLGIEAAPSAWVERARSLVVERPHNWTTLSPSARARLERACLPGMRVLERLS
jgi:hypothetical protein